MKSPKALPGLTDNSFLHFEFPALDETLCTGCGECVAVCPTSCLEMIGPIPWLARPAHCISCSFCALICPAHALRMEHQVAE